MGLVKQSSDLEENQSSYLNEQSQRPVLRGLYFHGPWPCRNAKRQRISDSVYYNMFCVCFVCMFAKTLPILVLFWTGLGLETNIQRAPCRERCVANCLPLTPKQHGKYQRFFSIQVQQCCKTRGLINPTTHDPGKSKVWQIFHPSAGARATEQSESTEHTDTQS